MININADLDDAMHYNQTLALLGDIRLTLQELNRALRKSPLQPDTAWLRSCAEKKAAWEAFKAERFQTPVLPDEYWGGPVLTQPAAIKIAPDWAKERDAVVFFDAGDVQANGFQIVEDDRPDRTFTETGASYMGFAVSALLATAAGLAAFLRAGPHRRWIVHDEPADPDRRRRARRTRLHPDSGQRPDGRHHRVCSRPSTARSSPRLEHESTWIMLAWGRAVPGLLALDGGRTPIRCALPCNRPDRTRGSR